MAITPKLELRQGQQLVMTPQLQQAIRLLQFSNLELSAFVETELERNPLLERDERDEHGGAAAERAEPAADAARSEAPEGLDRDIATPAADPAATFDTDAENVYPEATGSDSGMGWASLRQRMGSSDDHADLEDYASSGISLREHLSRQLQLLTANPVERLVGGYLIDQVNEAGYLTADMGEVADMLGLPLDAVERVLERLQRFEPAGVLARNLAECLAIQLRDRNRFDPVIARLVANLDLLAARDMARLKRAVGVEADELAEMIEEIRALNPKPGLAFGSVEVQPVVPDVIVRAARDGSWHVELNGETLPRLLVNRSYYARVSRCSRTEQDRSYLADCLQTANWLTKSLDQRARTILKVAQEIVRRQDGFLAHGVQHLKPLNLKTVADAIGMHESTVSRVTSNKYVATPRGIFELKYFFTSAIAAAEQDGEAHSSEAVRHRIKELIEAEAPAAVLSDDKLVEVLKKEGIDIARRTVAKYREAMRIPSSVQRRREKRMAMPRRPGSEMAAPAVR